MFVKYICELLFVISAGLFLLVYFSCKDNYFHARFKRFLHLYYRFLLP